jgi:hypothetical protein
VIACTVKNAAAAAAAAAQGAALEADTWKSVMLMAAFTSRSTICEKYDPLLGPHLVPLVRLAI